MTYKAYKNNRNGKLISKNNTDDIKRAMSVIFPLCLFSLLLAGAFCAIFNDMYAFVKKDAEKTVFVEDDYTLRDISLLLGEMDIVDNPYVFMMYVRSKNKIEVVENFYGEITLNSSMSYREILSSFS